MIHHESFQSNARLTYPLDHVIVVTTDLGMKDLVGQQGTMQSIVKGALPQHAYAHATVQSATREPFITFLYALDRTEAASPFREDVQKQFGLLPYLDDTVCAQRGERISGTIDGLIATSKGLRVRIRDAQTSEYLAELHRQVAGHAEERFSTRATAAEYQRFKARIRGQDDASKAKTGEAKLRQRFETQLRNECYAEILHAPNYGSQYEQALLRLHHDVPIEHVVLLERNKLNEQYQK